MTPEKALIELREMFPGEEFNIRTETWTSKGNTDEVKRGVTIDIGFPARYRISANTVEQAMAQLGNPYENQTCGECGYGAIDNTGLCVTDAEHKAVA